MRAFPFLLGVKGKDLSFHGTLDCLDRVGTRRQASIEKTNHVVARLAICKCHLVRDVHEEANWVDFLSSQGEPRADECSARIGTLCAERGCSWLLGIGYSTVRVTGGLERRGVGLGSVICRTFESDCVLGGHEK